MSNQDELDWYGDLWADWPRELRELERQKEAEEKAKKSTLGKQSE